MANLIDYFHAQPEEVRVLIHKAFAENDSGEVSVKQLIQERFGDRYTEQEIGWLWYIGLYLHCK